MSNRKKSDLYDGINMTSLLLSVSSQKIHKVRPRFDTSRCICFLKMYLLIIFRYEGHYYEIQAGILRQLSFSPTTQLRKVKYVIIHPGYVERQMQNDIAVIMLNKPLLFNRWVRQVCLPELNTAGHEWKKGPSPQSVCVAIGWGAVREYGPERKIFFITRVVIIQGDPEVLRGNSSHYNISR